MTKLWSYQKVGRGRQKCADGSYRSASALAQSMLFLKNRNSVLRLGRSGSCHGRRFGRQGRFPSPQPSLIINKNRKMDKCRSGAARYPAKPSSTRPLRVPGPKTGIPCDRDHTYRAFFCGNRPMRPVNFRPDRPRHATRGHNKALAMCLLLRLRVPRPQ